MTARARPPAAAGAFYPADPSELAATVDRLLADARPPPGPRPLALIVPHAGYRYSGPIAAVGYAALGDATGIDRVALLGPAHFVRLAGVAVPAAEAWRTPLGEVPVDGELRDAVLAPGEPWVVDDEPHAVEHALEVQLPFLQRVLGAGVAVLPVAVGTVDAAAVASLVGSIRAVPGTLVVVSTDLSHYHDRSTAERLDRRTVDAVLAGNPVGIGADAACGVFALRGIVEHARAEALEVRLLALGTSADTAGDEDRVVGYAACALWP